MSQQNTCDVIGLFKRVYRHLLSIGCVDIKTTVISYNSHTLQMEKAVGGRYICNLCPLVFLNSCSIRLHIIEQHSKNPRRCPCSICGKVLRSAASLKQHRGAFHTEKLSWYRYEYCGVSFTTISDRDVHQRRNLLLPFKEHGVNLHLYLQKVEKEKVFQGEWMFVKNPVNGKYLGQDTQGLQRFQVEPKTVLVKRSNGVEHLRSPLTTDVEKVEVIFKHPNVETLVEGQSHSLNLKTKYHRGCLTFTAL